MSSASPHPLQVITQYSPPISKHAVYVCQTMQFREPGTNGIAEKPLASFCYTLSLAGNRLR